FFRRTIFADGHRNVVRAVANGLTRSGSVDGYVWEVLSQVEPELAGRTRVVSRSEWFGFPPIVCRSDRVNAAEIEAFSRALLTMQDLDAGRVMLRTLHLDGFARPELQLFDGIAARMAEVGPQP
ncbi:MAG: PhnD/SsuA/transferrin family substrate-binding protein, partial [Roseovarius sp.]|nr:PhnD/SsuA/transferrin family substrate-binding protein [Roseovarius sp.]